IEGTEEEKKHFDRNTMNKWNAFFKSPPTQLGAGTIFFLADKASPGWREKYEARKSPAPTRAEVRSPSAVFDPWQRYIVPAFPLDILPLEIQDYVQAQAEIIGCDVSGMAMSVLGTFSGALHHEFALKMQRNGTWYANPRLWVLFVTDPSQRKTPMFKAATRPLVEKEGLRAPEIPRRIARVRGSQRMRRRQESRD